MKVIIVIILSIIFITSSIVNYREVIGNTDNQILTFIEESKLFDTIGLKNINIIDTQYIENSKIVAIQSDTGQGYILYEKNRKGNYVMVDSNFEIIGNNMGVSNYIVQYNRNNDYICHYAFLVISNGSKVANVELKINGERSYYEKMEIGKPSIVMKKALFKAGENDDIVSLHCRYFDINNKEIDMN